MLPLQISGCTANNDDQSPIVCVTWDHAKAYCTAAGRRLCTESEWEYAARGKDGRIWPNGNKPPSCLQANEKNCDGKPRLVGITGSCGSPFGPCDQAGNIEEWVADDYGVYTATPKVDPPPANTPSDFKVTRGGHFDSPYDNTRASKRQDTLPSGTGPNIGIRCCKNLK